MRIRLCCWLEVAQNAFVNHSNHYNYKSHKKGKVYENWGKNTYNEPNEIALKFSSSLMTNVVLNNLRAAILVNVGNITWHFYGRLNFFT